MLICASHRIVTFMCFACLVALSAAITPRPWTDPFILQTEQSPTPTPAPAAQQPAPQPPQRNVVLVLIDGLRWQEVFTGAEEALIDKDIGGVDDVAALRKQFWRDTAESRREALMPFLWSEIATRGQLIGNQTHGSVARVSNAFNFSYPGYSEMICGFADPRIDSNDQKPNPNISVLEWLNTRPGFGGKIAVFGAWDTVAWIVNRERCGLFVNTGWEPVPADAARSERGQLLNELKSQSPRRWRGEPDDAITFHSALEYLKQHQPRVLWLTFGETDEFAHEGQYDLYLESANKTDAMLQQLWQTLQSIEKYRDNTTVIVAVDHGRGSGPKEWRDHGEKVPESRFIWLGIIGPDTPPTGEWRIEPNQRKVIGEVLQAQIASTLAAAVGEDWCAAEPKAAKPIPDVIAPSNP